MGIRVSLKLLDSNSNIYQEILKALLPQVNQYMSKAILSIKPEIINIVGSSIRNSPEYGSIQSGQLKYELGIPDPSSRLESLINIWLNNIQSTYDKPVISNNKIKSSFTFEMIKSDFSDVLSTDFATVRDNMRGYDLPWLRWLLLEGNKTIVSKYEVLFGQNKASRTGFAVMTPSNRSWKVPSTFSGNISDNWITRAIDSASSQIQSLLDRSLNS
jgi:hypothetical protein